MNKIRHYRELTGLSITDLASAIGGTAGAVGHYELNRRTPKLAVAREIVRALNKAGASCSLDDVFPPAKVKPTTKPKRKAA